MGTPLSIPAAKLYATTTDVVFGRDTAGAGAGEEISMSALRTMAGLVIGTNVQAYNAATLFGALGSVDNRIARVDGTGGVTLQGSSVSITDSGIIQNAIGYWNDDNSAYLSNATNGGFAFGPTLSMSWAATNAGGTKHVGLIQKASGVLGVTDGASGYGALRALSFTAYESAGVKNVALSHNGTNGIIQVSSGYLGLRSPNGNGIRIVDGTSLIDIQSEMAAVNAFSNVNALALGSSGGGTVYANMNCRVGNTYLYGFASGSGWTTGIDTALARSLAKVIGLTDGSTAGGTLSSVPLTPAQITANQDNYAPGVARYYRLSTDASRNITGLSCSQVTGQECEVWNVGSFDIVLKHDVTSTAANRFLCTAGADITLAANEVALLRYDGTTARWRVRKI